MSCCFLCEVEGLLPKASLTAKGFLDAGIISYSVALAMGGNHQFNILKKKNVGSYMYCSAIFTMYHGGIEALATILIDYNSCYIKNISDNGINANGVFQFYKNSVGDLIIKINNDASSRIRILMLDSANIDMPKSMVENNEDVSSMEKIEIH